ncbi:DUF6445 family protein [Colwellia sp. MSW7]|uniref:DUF6445 family protein n=1 Tax=Colwellia maritima TaxID=2912588 RepID=A0ABS9WZW2_9GAMM|nr:DUF6445 family protein [Colwellia maritima]MCI2283533.1 DUF6445 family protein [Colwellia maritima]
MIKVNRQATLNIEYIGQDKTPILIIDNYADNHNELVDQVIAHAQFIPDEVTNYPGIRSAIPKALVVGYLKPLIEVLYRVYKLPDLLQPNPIDNYLSLITKQPNELSAMQSWPHFDTPNPNLIAIIHYMNKGTHGGTAFFKHNKSGLDRINNDNKETYLKFAQAYFQSSTLRELNYCNEQHNEFTCYKTVAYKPNRLIVFPGQLLHSTLVNAATDINSDPITGRLTANLFLSFK